MNKIFASGKKLEDLFDVQELLDRLISAMAIDASNLEVQCRLRDSDNLNQHDKINAMHQRNFYNKLENLNVLSYSLFLITQNMLINRSGEHMLFESLFTVIQMHKATITNCLCLLIRADREPKNVNIEKILGILLKLIYILSNIEAQYDKSSQEKLKIKRKLSVLAPPMASAHHKSYRLFKCILESIVLHIAQEAKAEQMRVIFGFFRKYTICCCNIHLDVVHKILINSQNEDMHKVCLNFIKQNILRTVFMNNITCGNCDTSTFIFEFKERFVALYKTWFKQLADPVEIIVFFKHIAKISKYLHVDVQSHILVDIVLPMFRKEKIDLAERTKPVRFEVGMGSCSSLDTEDSDSEFSDKVTICCLNIFLCYLKDITVVKAFFIEENIQHLADLFVIPQFAYLVSNLLKIGIDNSRFLGETLDERHLLCEKLESLQIQLFTNIIDILVHLFNDMSISYDFRLKRTNKVGAGKSKSMINHNACE